jgi:hypothetical protein
MELKDVGWAVMDWIQNRDRWRIPVNAVKNLRVPINAENFSAT